MSPTRYAFLIGLSIATICATVALRMAQDQHTATVRALVSRVQALETRLHTQAIGLEDVTTGLDELTMRFQAAVGAYDRAVVVAAPTPARGRVRQ